MTKKKTQKLKMASNKLKKVGRKVESKLTQAVAKRKDRRYQTSIATVEDQELSGTSISSSGRDASAATDQTDPTQHTVDYSFDLNITKFPPSQIVTSTYPTYR